MTITRPSTEVQYPHRSPANVQNTSMQKTSDVIPHHLQSNLNYQISPIHPQNVQFVFSNMQPPMQMQQLMIQYVQKGPQPMQQVMPQQISPQ